jgi:MSHA biogenesis protein MshJ
VQAKFFQLLNRLEALSLRERAMVLLGVPLVLLVAGEFLVFAPARKQAAEALKQSDLQQAELKALSATLAALPVAAPLPGADQLLRQRNELQGQIDAARAIVASVNQSIDWGTVVRATVAGTPGLTLTQLKTMPAELVFSPSTAKPAAAPAASSAKTAAGANAKAPAPAASGATMPSGASASEMGAGGMSIYRHRAELTVKGNFGTLLGYLQTLQRVPGDLHWDRLQFSVTGYPQASIQLTLYTLSNRAETPFN